MKLRPVVGNSRLLPIRARLSVFLTIPHLRDVCTVREQGCNVFHILEHVTPFNGFSYLVKGFLIHNLLEQYLNGLLVEWACSALAVTCQNPLGGCILPDPSQGASNFHISGREIIQITCHLGQVFEN